MLVRAFVRFVLLFTFAETATGQEPSQALDATALAKDLVVPLHTQTADPIGGEYGIWAAGSNYKASFHDGFTLYPVLGPAAPMHLPLGWRTAAVAIGGQALPLGESVVRWSGLRFERDFGGVVETYDVRCDGVEQTFTLSERPRMPGDLVITGAITTPLVCEAAGPAQQTLTFRNGSEPVIRYGKALALDALGNECAVSTSWDGTRIRLSLPGSFLAKARFPVVVDPLIAPVILQSGLGGPMPAITARPETNGKMVVAWSRPITSQDHDAYAVMVSRDYSSGTWIYQDLQTAWSSLDIGAAYVGSGQQWVISQRRNFGANSNHVRVYLHAVNNTVVNSGSLLYPSAPAGFEDFGPVVGGSRYGGTALMITNRVHTASGAAGVVGVRIDALFQSLGTDVSFTAGFLEQLWDGQITPLTLGTGGWVVAMKGTSGIRVAKVPNQGSGAVPTSLLVAPASMPLPVLPTLRLAGTEGRYLLVYIYRLFFPSIGQVTDGLRSVRFDWPSGASNPTILATNGLASTSSWLTQPFEFPLGGLAHDLLTRSHWVLTVHGPTPAHPAVVRRLGYSGGVVESRSVSGPCDVAFALAGADGSFPLAYSTGTAGVNIVGSELTYAADAISVAYGTSCSGPGVGVTTNRSFAGHEFFRVRLINLAPGTPCLYLLADAPGSFDLTGSGMPGCFLNIGLPAMASVVAVADGSGDAQVMFALPDAPVLIGDVYSQWFYFDPTAAPVPFRAHGGVRHQIR